MLRIYMGRSLRGSASQETAAVITAVAAIAGSTIWSADQGLSIVMEGASSKLAGRREQCSISRLHQKVPLHEQWL